MTKEEILEGNKLIAEFMQDIDNSTNWRYVDGRLTNGVSWLIPEYHTSWDWLMPCVEKINKLNILKISSNLGTLKMKVKGSLYGIGVDNTIEDVWEAVVLFIKTYNEKCSE